MSLENRVIFSAVVSLIIQIYMFVLCVFAGVLGVVSLLFISLHSNLHLYLALFWMTISSAAMAIADVTIDACTAYNSIKHPSLASDMQSLCSLSSSIGALLGFFMSGILVHLVGSKVS